LKDDAALDDYLEEAGLEGLVLDTREGQRSGKDLKTLVDHARRMRTLMRYAPRKYDGALIEALAINGALGADLEAQAFHRQLAGGIGIVVSRLAADLNQVVMSRLGAKIVNLIEDFDHFIPGTTPTGRQPFLDGMDVHPAPKWTKVEPTLPLPDKAEQQAFAPAKFVNEPVGAERPVLDCHNKYSLSWC
jgi:hypothetical protein